MPDDKVLDVNVVPTIADDPQRVAIAKGINDLLNSYIAITDSKAVAFLGGATAAASLFLARVPDGWLLLTFYVLSAVCYAGGALCAANVIFPRIPKCCGTNVIFWGDIAGCPRDHDYAAALEQKCAAGGLTTDYAALNHTTSRILRRKVHSLRLAMALSLAGLAFSVPVFIIARQ